MLSIFLNVSANIVHEASYDTVMTWLVHQAISTPLTSYDTVETRPVHQVISTSLTSCDRVMTQD